ncbi:hypothetical protein [Pedobacter boryungensis]|uniref:Alpha-L-rhamnosidase six-hairpin glycosidase domain-containing protein n=1 Tax=Pedobacter boryungensis TaxID=869962 RepID=A0ABX2D998_9SPHI|nr:hypothetical protein [Pedobacter boryungensis]NQX30632.1 hypothetical protein [Pedobacter boryungensis]
MNGISPWQIAATNSLGKDEMPTLVEKTIGDYTFTVLQANDALYIYCKWKTGSIAFRPIYSPDHGLVVKRKSLTDNGITISLESALGTSIVKIEMINAEYPILKYNTTITPKTNLHIPFWPKDIILRENKQPEKNKGTVHVKQVGTRSGILHFSLDEPNAGSIFYFQNLTSLADYNEQTKTSGGETVGGLWPDLGFSLPVTKDDPLKAKTSYTISDAIIAFDQVNTNSESELTKQYLNLLAAIYLEIPKPTTHYMNWPEILEKGLYDLIDAPGCWNQVEGNQYFNAYISDYDTPPEIMVQLAVLLPLLDYTEWSGKSLPVVDKIKKGLPEFWDEKLKTIVRWLPAAQDKLKGEEEQKKPMVMDSWYLHHPLLNLSRLALKGDKQAAELFLNSLPYAMKVAKHFKYNWPVFYKMNNLEVLKAETKPGEGGQHDVAGLYAHVMIQAYELTKDKKYLKEAEVAANSLKGKDFKLFYQANNTTFSAGALLRLYKLTKNQDYLDLSNLCLANVFQNVQLWDCNYGYGKNYPTFFAIFPLSDAPYTAVYEEQEVFCALHDYLQHAKDVDILPSIRLLVNEFIRYLVNRAAYYYPPMLPNEMLSDEVKVGEVDNKLWVALEDLHDGWEKSGEVGQEVYGAGNAFGILPRHYHNVDEKFMLYADNPIPFKRKTSSSSLSIQLAGDERIECRLRIIPKDVSKTKFELYLADGTKLSSKKTKEGHLEFVINGNQQLKINW